MENILEKYHQITMVATSMVE